ncbi:MAG TPA: transglycosylase SLT domain-containing protein [Candidatus Sulfotelmatobacter sp.]|nr:transglycosylase SLT domain-containing protein [Candidatus Sulfotelmatobacter sp.]
MEKAAFLSLIVPLANPLELPPLLVLAMVEQESGYNPLAIRFEPPYRFLWDVIGNKPFRPLTPAESASEAAPADFPVPAGWHRNSEWSAQQWSWGPLQIMGANARAVGFKDRFFPELCADPGLGLMFGMKHLAVQRRRFFAEHGWDGVVGAYNAGTPTAPAAAKYAGEVKARCPGGEWPA